MREGTCTGIWWLDVVLILAALLLAMFLGQSVALREHAIAQWLDEHLPGEKNP